MTEAQKTKTSKFLSLVLLHQPEVIGLQLDAAGWAGVDDLLSRLAAHGHAISFGDLVEVVRTNAKQRFVFDDECTTIRANQGHSVDVDLGLIPLPPPEVLYHGTVDRFIPAIRQEGLQKQSRQHVHLSQDVQTATAVGQRRGKPVILEIRSGEMNRAGLLFYQSQNGVWLTDAVPPQYITFPTP